MKTAASTVPAFLADMPDMADMPGVQRGLKIPDAPAEWRLSTFLGRLAEISGADACASLTLVFRLVLEAQQQAEPVVWVGRKASMFYPPDVADIGVDLNALTVVWAPEARLASRAADFCDLFALLRPIR